MSDIRMNPKMMGIVNFNTEELINEDCTGKRNFPNDIGECKIYLYSDEGLIPHFHIIPKKGGKECCICIYQPYYFNHGITEQVRLNSKQRKILNEWMNQPSKLEPVISNWKIVSGFWQTGNEDDPNVPENPVQPNYNDLIYWRN